MSDTALQSEPTSKQRDARFLFACCQVGAEKALKHEFSVQWPELRLAYSRPGFVTFKVPAESDLPDNLDLRSVFARAAGMSIGRLSGENATDLARQAWHLLGERTVRNIHVWQRDSCIPGQRGFWPGATVLANEIGSVLAAEAPSPMASSLAVNQRAGRNEGVLDCTLVEPHEWWIGFHTAGSPAGRWPGGVAPADLPSYAASRAYAKMSEALEWSRFPLLPGDAVVEIGSAPGGAAQALLDCGALVTGVDPAAMDERVVANSNFRWIRKRGSDVKRRDYAPYRWLMADVNVAPKFTLDMVADIVQHDATHVQGLILTLKLLQWELAAEIPSYVERIRSWGYRYVRARQLAFNRQEVCVVALKSRSHRRGRPKR